MTQEQETAPKQRLVVSPDVLIEYIKRQRDIAGEYALDSATIRQEGNDTELSPRDYEMFEKAFNLVLSKAWGTGQPTELPRPTK